MSPCPQTFVARYCGFCICSEGKYSLQLGAQSCLYRALRLRQGSSQIFGTTIGQFQVLCGRAGVLLSLLHHELQPSRFRSLRWISDQTPHRANCGLGTPVGISQSSMIEMHMQCRLRDLCDCSRELEQIGGMPLQCYRRTATWRQLRGVTVSGPVGDKG